MGRSTPKTVPKDGPVASFLNNGTAVDAGVDLVGMTESLALLSRANCKEMNIENINNSTPSQVLWRVLVTADEIRSQLQALQAFKSKVIQLKDSISSDALQKQELVGTYRLLLEWSLSNNIPTPLRRAIASNLSTLDSILGEEAYRIRKQVIESLLVEQQYWSSPLGTLFEMLNYESTRSVIFNESDLSVNCLGLLISEANELQPFLTEHSFYTQATNKELETLTTRTDLAAIESCTLIASILKLFLTQVLLYEGYECAHLGPLLTTLQRFLLNALSCRGMPSDNLNVIGVTYGQALLLEWKLAVHYKESSCSSIAECAAERVNDIAADLSLPELNKLAAIQGIIAALPNDALMEGSPPLFHNVLAPYLMEQCRTATGASVRLSALRALNTLVNKCASIMSTPYMEEHHLSYISQLSNDTLKVVLESWESPPARQVATAIPGLFRSLLVLLRKSDELHGKASSNLDKLVKRILDLPANRKGKYVALETLLPEVGASTLVDVAGDDLIASLIKGIGVGDHNIVALSDLLGNFLSRLRIEMNEKAGLSTANVLSKKERRKREKAAARVGSSSVVASNRESPQQELPFVTDWVALWCPHFAHGLISGSSSSRKHVATRCLPLLVDIVGGPARRQDATFAFSFLLNEVVSQTDRLPDSRNQVASFSSETEVLSDSVLVALFAIAKQVSLQKLLIPPYCSVRLTSAISTSVPYAVLISSLTHSSESIRLAAFASIEAIIPTYYSSQMHALQIIEQELSIWRKCLPYSSKSASKAFFKELFQILSSLLNRLSDEESAGNNVNGGEYLPALTSFVRDFLIDEMILRQTGYPGTVEEKESFVLGLYRCILSYASQDIADSQTGMSKGSRHPSQCCRKHPRPIEKVTMHAITTFLLSDEAVSVLFSLLHSTWDGTRAAAFACLCQLVERSNARNVSFPKRFASPDSVRYIEARSIHLAASPRQREADTGARTLALIGAMYKTDDERSNHINTILALLEERLAMMGDVLGMPSSFSGQKSSLLGDGSRMPMTHGLMMALRLTVEDNSFALPESDSFYEKFVAVCCRALRLSLSVVADVKEGATPTGEKQPEGSENRAPSGTPINVNTGAIGANAGFSSIQESDEDESFGRFAYQRIIVGSWLMTKEACTSLASTITCNKFEPSLELVESVGSLLISTLTTLKHQGAAFAAHRALQDIVAFCFKTSCFKNHFASHPILWANRLMEEISGAGHVRDSTLRRSTGYGLAFLSIMRSEPPSSVTPRMLCPDIMLTLLQMSLPSEEELQSFLQRIDLSEATTSSLTSPSSSRFATNSKQEQIDEQCRTRVHALNILRLIILDAPLVATSRPFIGDAIVSSMIGYEDSRWAVRNSATMVVASVMLRVVDADKNASSNSSSNAITATEFFRSYPALVDFLLCVMKKEVKEMDAKHSFACFGHTSLYPILLLLSRLQPVSVSSQGTTEVTDVFVPVILQCLKHHEHKVRLVAARALANLASDEAGRQSYACTLLGNCEKMLQISENRPQWNTIHGALLGIQNILRTRSKLEAVLSCLRELEENVLRFVDSRRGLFWCPPPCTAVALEIAVSLATSMIENAVDKKNNLMHTCLWIVSELNRRNLSSSLSHHIGEARLGAVAARGFLECCLTEIWKPNLDSSRRKTMLDSILLLLENDTIDVRLEATKAFKKSIYSEIDQLLSRSNITRRAKQNTLFEVASVLRKALETEVDRIEKVSIGFHPPTVRRLSRCLLECLYALQTLDCRFDEGIIDTTDTASSRRIWSVALRISDAKGITTDDIARVNNVRILNGNALELMAFAVQGLLCTGETTSTTQAFVKLRFFVQFVARMNHDQELWRLRHSVAVAVETSRVLMLSIDDATFKECKLSLTNELLLLLQDGDPDVRSVAGRAISQAFAQKDSLSSSSQLALVNGYGAVSSQPPDDRMASILLESLVISCRDVMVSIDRFDREVAYSRTSSSWNDIMNLDSERKIFEDEIKNPFEELLLANQLRTMAIVKSKAKLDSQLVRELFDLCAQVLSRLLDGEMANQKSKREADIAHELTRSNAIFPLIHSIINGSIAAIFVGVEAANEVRDLARKVSQLVGEREVQTAVHPRIVESIEILSNASPGDDATCDGLFECCFLVSERNRSS